MNTEATGIKGEKVFWDPDADGIAHIRVRPIQLRYFMPGGHSPTVLQFSYDGERWEDVPTVKPNGMIRQRRPRIRDWEARVAEVEANAKAYAEMEGFELPAYRRFILCEVCGKELYFHHLPTQSDWQYLTLEPCTHED